MRCQKQKKEETYKSYGTLLPVLEWEARKKTTIATNNKQPEDRLNSP